MIVEMFTSTTGIVFIFIYIMATIVRDCSPNPGTEFLLVFPQTHENEDYADGEITYEIFITLDTTKPQITGAQVTLTLKDPDEEHIMAVNQSSPGVFLQSPNNRTFPTGNHKGQRFLMHVTATDDVTVAVKNGKFLSSNVDSYLAIPVTQLGDTYVALAYSSSIDIAASFIVIATGNKPAYVKITLPVESNNIKSTNSLEISYNNFTYQSNDIMYLNLDPFEACQLQFALSDITGTLIESDAAIALWSGNNRTVFEGMVSKNHVIEQIPPIEMAGTQFVACSRFNQNPPGVYIFVNIHKNTEILVHSFGESPKSYLLYRARSVLELSFSVQDDEVSYIETSKPSIVYYVSSSAVDGIGDVFSMLIPPLDAEHPSGYSIQFERLWTTIFDITFVVQGSVSDITIDGFSLESANSRFNLNVSVYTISGKPNYFAGYLIGRNPSPGTRVLEHSLGMPFLAFYEEISSYSGHGYPLSYGFNFPIWVDDDDDDDDDDDSTNDDTCCATVDSKGVSLFDNECGGAEKVACCLVDYRNLTSCKVMTATKSCELLNAPKLSSYQRVVFAKTTLACDAICSNTPGCLGVNVDQAAVDNPASGTSCQLLFGSTFGQNETTAGGTWRYLRCSTIVEYLLNST